MIIEIQITKLLAKFLRESLALDISYSDGVSRLGLGFFLSLGLEGLRSRLGLEAFRSQSRALRLETLRRLFFMKFCKKEFL